MPVIRVLVVFQKLIRAAWLDSFASVGFDPQIRIDDVIDRNSYKCVDYLPYLLYAIRYTFMPVSDPLPPHGVRRNVDSQRGQGTSDTGIAARPVSQSADQSLDAARHKVTLAEKAEKEAEKEGGA